MSISLCIPAYNASSFLPELFESIKKQKIPFDEVILYDDGSTDNTADLARKFEAVVVKDNRNSGCSHAKNEMAKIAKSEWLFFLDADDILLSNFTERAFKWITKFNAPDIILMKYDYIDAVSNRLLYTPEYDRYSLLKDPVQFMINNKVVNSCIIKKEKFIEIDGFALDKNLLYIEDRAFSIKASLAGFSFDMDDVSAFVIRCYSESMSTKNPANWLKAAIKLWENTYKIVGDKYRKELCGQLFSNALWAAKYSEWGLVVASLQLVGNIDATQTPPGGFWFQKLYQLHPIYAYKIRKYLLSFFKSLTKQ